MPRSRPGRRAAMATEAEKQAIRPLAPPDVGSLLTDEEDDSGAESEAEQEGQSVVDEALEHAVSVLLEEVEV